MTSGVRVRFAPSPTGYLHIGGLRTALYNYLYARQHNGSFILRIEDTDQSRFVEGAIDNLLMTLKWIGLEYDEGPDIGGAFGPYMQSQRLPLYRDHVERLLANGHAYRCFCKPAELEESRNRQNVENRTYMYDRRCRYLADNEISEKLAGGSPFTVRLKAPIDRDVSFEDEIRGHITVAGSAIDDQVLLKSDGFPTYHLANVVDDHCMEISRVIRGEEWLPSTPKHVLLYEAFGWHQPVFAHLPLLLNPDRSKLSKRQGDVAVEDYRAKGYVPEALLNFVALLGWAPPDNRELFTKQELVHAFSLDRVGKSGAVFDLEKLTWFNAQYLHAMPFEDVVPLCLPFLEQSGYPTDDRAFLEKFIGAMLPRMSLPSDIVHLAPIFFTETVEYESEEARMLLSTDTSGRVLKEVLRHMNDLGAWDRESLKSMIKDIQKATGVKGKELFMPMRVALTGQLHGPDLPIVMELLGREKVSSRLAEALVA